MTGPADRRMVVGGQWRDAGDGAVPEAEDPATEEVTGTFPAGTAADVDAAVEESEYFAGIASQTRGGTAPQDPGSLSCTLRRPYGVVGRIVPYDRPTGMPFAGWKRSGLGQENGPEELVSYTREKAGTVTLL